MHILGLSTRRGWKSRLQEIQSKNLPKILMPCVLIIKQKKQSLDFNLGNLQIRFTIEDLEQFWQENQQYKEDTDLTKMRYPSILKWMLKIYIEYCEDCGSAGQPLVYESQLKACQIQFCIVVTNILNDIKPNKNKGNRKKLVQVHHHKEELCEACQKGECYNVPKETTQIVRKKQV